eukprot:7075810-Prymnesium_polylepis.1
MRPLEELGAHLEDEDPAGPMSECVVCHQPCVLAVVRCGCLQGNIHCPVHAHSCRCTMAQKTVSVRHSVGRLSNLLALLQSRLARRQHWVDEVAAALTSSPAISAVEALLTEAHVMQIQDELYDQLQRLATSGIEWQMKAGCVLSSSAIYPPEYLMELIVEGRAIPLQLTLIEKLETTLAQ